MRDPAKVFEGVPCKRCNGTERWASSRACTACTKAKQRTPEQRERTRIWRSQNKEAHKIMKDSWREANREEIREWNSAWRKRNLKRMCAHVIAYNQRKRKVMPAWADREAIQRIYENCPSGHQVDHAIPLRGKFVSGLHVESNLQYLLDVDNNRKGNRYVA